MIRCLGNSQPFLCLGDRLVEFASLRKGMS